jgi:hypothetical protein
MPANLAHRGLAIALGSRSGWHTLLFANHSKHYEVSLGHTLWTQPISLWYISERRGQTIYVVSTVRFAVLAITQNDRVLTRIAFTFAHFAFDVLHFRACAVRVAEGYTSRGSRFKIESK